MENLQTTYLDRMVKLGMMTRCHAARIRETAQPPAQPVVAAKP